jgi:hypothetical protein
MTMTITITAFELNSRPAEARDWRVIPAFAGRSLC